MKLCFVASGISLHAKKWLDWFASHGHEVHLITPPYRVPYREFHEGVQVHVLPEIWPVSYRLSRVINMPVWVAFAHRLVRIIKPDLLEGQYIGVPGYIATMANWEPLILQCWGSDILLDTKKPWYRWMTKKALKRADMVLCDSETVKAGLKQLDTDMGKVRKMYNGIDTQFFSPTSMRSRPLVISTRDLAPVYDIETTIRAMASVREHFPNVRLVVVGDGEDRGKLEKLAEKLMPEGAVFTGNVSQQEVRDWLTRSRVYVSTSKSDSTSLSLQEAMACGLPCVVSSLPANKEWITHETSGMLTAVGNSFDTANRIKQLLRDEERRERFGRLGRMKVVKEADYDMNMRKVEGYYRELINNAG